MATFPFFSLCSSLLAVSLGIFIQFNAKQPKPYMDEIFHIPQAQKYCHYKFQEWDPKITTLPGMYVLSFMGLRVLSFFHDNYCFVYTAHRIERRIKWTRKKKQSSLMSWLPSAQ
ncbi:PREDICTED: dol-P-Glc:Glc(2)Man(9)GlcNAc(2)-PP-Dol alpha-1,2-glucosyltransferase-like isoform X2 [Acropora digitifera]|uniref:dol-P-Glc:Glc(2)Man(9)GlcNAc(2)-PP-Dol alpha-1,2-glucosyltransferase-like isoform X2 n=1 Tax=Acropora digitifera TaxID=70779 RepID=UPI00077AC4C9|nr:PREDICTED: dol-P-Glc:Glc(2)Man(9)GlcNAc(2)-PP-Dol alpha-1,2-glucosyltransferase-like isoform X2 [Acropora digitifera]